MTSSSLIETFSTKMHFLSSKSYIKSSSKRCTFLIKDFNLNSWSSLQDASGLWTFSCEALINFNMCSSRIWSLVFSNCGILHRLFLFRWPGQSFRNYGFVPFSSWGSHHFHHFFNFFVILNSNLGFYDSATAFAPSDSAT